ncbi:hypothetical protein B0H10DRAFT_2185840 [Mycena sp. CBHHK59/15]|nr:hypothetical protein B0H10DRAFT_2185840 [Mycena sp. CBHHK59/15]
MPLLRFGVIAPRDGPTRWWRSRGLECDFGDRSTNLWQNSNMQMLRHSQTSAEPNEHRKSWKDGEVTEIQAISDKRCHAKNKKTRVRHPPRSGNRAQQLVQTGSNFGFEVVYTSLPSYKLSSLWVTMWIHTAFPLLIPTSIPGYRPQNLLCYDWTLPTDQLAVFPDCRGSLQVPSGVSEWLVSLYPPAKIVSAYIGPGIWKVVLVYLHAGRSGRVAALDTHLVFFLHVLKPREISLSS